MASDGIQSIQIQMATSREQKPIRCMVRMATMRENTESLTQLNEDRWQTHHRVVSLDPTRASMETCCLSLGGITVACLCPSMLLKRAQTCQIDMNGRALWDVQGQRRGICTSCACFVQTILSENRVSFKCHKH